VKIFVKPYADIYIDGALVAKDARDHVASLRPGAHKVEFKNRFFETQEAAADVPEKDPVKEIRVELAKVRPGLIRVAATPPADLYVDDVFRGQSSATAKDPVAVPIPRDKGSRTVRLRLVKQGFKTVAQDVELEPGAVREIKVTLTPEGR
jgi:hypothetical protein